jgi:hypothetical protein
MSFSMPKVVWSSKDNSERRVRLSASNAEVRQ